MNPVIETVAVHQALALAQTLLSADSNRCGRDRR